MGASLLILGLIASKKFNFDAGFKRYKFYQEEIYAGLFSTT